MPGKKNEGSTAVPPFRGSPCRTPDSAERTFDWVEYTCPCPNCGAEVDGFQTKDLCRQLDRIDYRTVYHFYAMCHCGTWIDFIRKAARGIDEFDMYTEQL